MHKSGLYDFEKCSKNSRFSSVGLSKFILKTAVVLQPFQLRENVLARTFFKRREHEPSGPWIQACERRL